MASESGSPLESIRSYAIDLRARTPDMRWPLVGESASGTVFAARARAIRKPTVPGGWRRGSVESRVPTRVHPVYRRETRGRIRAAG